jgi:hypothetical protein
VCLSCFIFASFAIITVDAHARAHNVCSKTNTNGPGPGKYIRLLYVVVGSAVGNFSALFGKAFSGLLFVSISGEDQFNDDPFVLVILVVFAVSLPLQIHLINASLAVNDILFHIPNFYVFWYVGNIATGAVFYDETAHFGRWNWAFFGTGISVLVLGVLGTNLAATYKRNGDHKHRTTTGVVSKQYHNIKDTDIKDTDTIDSICSTDGNDTHNIVPGITLETAAVPSLSLQQMPTQLPPLVTDERPDNTTHTCLA